MHFGDEKLETRALNGLFNMKLMLRFSELVYFINIF